MEDLNVATLSIEAGQEPEIIVLTKSTIVIGRGLPRDNRIALHSPFVSREHAEISYSNDCYSLKDLNSSNGTNINGNPIQPMTDYQLKDDDIINLADDKVILRFHQSDGTVKISNEEPIIPMDIGIGIDEQAREVWIDGQKLEPALPVLEYELLVYLYRNINKACSREDIASHVWKNEFVTEEQIENGVHRLRKRVEIDTSDPKRIITLRGYGYKLISDPADTNTR